MKLAASTFSVFAVRLAVVVATTGGTAGVLRAEILFSDAFDYPTGSLTASDDWSAHSTPGLAPVQVVAAAATLSQGEPSREDVHASFATLAAGQTLYVGFDLNNSGGNNQVYFAHFGRGGFVDFTTRIFITEAVGDGDYTLGVRTTEDFTPAKLSQGLTYGETYRVVGSYEFDSGISRLWVDPTSEAAPFAMDTDAAGSAVAINGFGLRQSEGDSQQVIDNLMVATSFAEVIAAPAMDADFNEDGIVNLADYTVWRDSLGAEVGAYERGDADGNGQVATADYTIWKQQFGTSPAERSASTLPLAVPEPNACGMLMLLLMACSVGPVRAIFLPQAAEGVTQ